MAPQNVYQSSIQEILREYPEAIQVFIQLKTQCVGCAFERFCTLEDVAKHYELDIEILIESLLGIFPKQNDQEMK
jgi:hybrid cluster-associated redox disulfide protein